MGPFVPSNEKEVDRDEENNTPDLIDSPTIKDNEEGTTDTISASSDEEMSDKEVAESSQQVGWTVINEDTSISSLQIIGKSHSYTDRSHESQKSLCHPFSQNGLRLEHTEPFYDHLGHYGFRKLQTGFLL